MDFHRQKPIGKYIADFYSHNILLVIEVDGASHTDIETKLKDVKKTEYIESIGINVLRFTDEEVLENTASVLQRIKEYVVAFRLEHPRE